MSDHLSECYFDATKEQERQLCICDPLRACEQRVRDEVTVFAETEWCKGHVVGEQNGYAAGVQAARDAVAATPTWDYGNAFKARALAAIDALRGES